MQPDGPASQITTRWPASAPRTALSGTPTTEAPARLFALPEIVPGQTGVLDVGLLDQAIDLPFGDDHAFPVGQHVPTILQHEGRGCVIALSVLIDHSGMLSCFFQGFSTVLLRNILSARQI